VPPRGFLLFLTDWNRFLQGKKKGKRKRGGKSVLEGKEGRGEEGKEFLLYSPSSVAPPKSQGGEKKERKEKKRETTTGNLSAFVHRPVLLRPRGREKEKVTTKRKRGKKKRTRLSRPKIVVFKDGK